MLNITMVDQAEVKYQVARLQVSNGVWTREYEGTNDIYTDECTNDSI